MFHLAAVILAVMVSGWLLYALLWEMGSDNNK